MKLQIRKDLSSKKLIGIITFLFLAFMVGMYVNYKSTGVFFKREKKLPIYCVDRNDKKVAISFDTSWGVDRTAEILDVLDKYKVKATFFVVGIWLDQYPDKVKEIYKRGHEIENHSDKHPSMITLSKEKMIKEIAACDAKIMALTGKRSTLFRCPSGAYNDEVIEVVEGSNHYCIQWDVDSIDWKEDGAEKEYERVMKNTKSGSILLFHNNAKHTPKNLSRIIETLKEKGFEFVKVSDIIYKDNYHIDSTGKQIKNH